MRTNGYLLLGSQNAAVRAEADLLENGGASVPMARCKLPPSRKIYKKIHQQLAKFGNVSWMYETQNHEDATAKALQAQQC